MRWLNLPHLPILPRAVTVKQRVIIIPGNHITSQLYVTPGYNTAVKLYHIQALLCYTVVMADQYKFVSIHLTAELIFVWSLI